MRTAVKTRLLMALGVFLAGVLALVALRSVAGVFLAAVLSGLSSQVLASAVAGSGKAGAGVHASAVLGAAAGSAMLWLQLRAKPRVDRVILVFGAFVAAYFGGLLASEIWPDVGPGGVGVAGTVAAYLVVPALETAMVLLRDVKWLRRLLGARAGVDDCQQCAVPDSTNDRNQ